MAPWKMMTAAEVAAAPEMVALVAAKQAQQAAMLARDAVESCVDPAWKAAHVAYRAACEVTERAQQAVYAAGLQPKPYWA